MSERTIAELKSDMSKRFKEADASVDILVAALESRLAVVVSALEAAKRTIEASRVPQTVADGALDLMLKWGPLLRQMDYALKVAREVTDD